MPRSLDRWLFITALALFTLLTEWGVATGHIPLGSSKGWGTLLAAGLTLAIYSFLYKDNPLFKFAEHVFIGVSMGYTLSQVWFNVVVNDVVTPLRNWSQTETWPLALIFISVVMGLLILFQISQSMSWVSRTPFAFVVGFGAGVGIPTVIAAFLLEQMRPSLAPLVADEQYAVLISVLLVGALAFAAKTEYLMDRSHRAVQIAIGVALASVVAWLGYGGHSNLLILVGVVSVLVYFFFSVEHTGTVGAISKVGIWFLMVAFGASFGFTIMARVSILIGRMRFLLGEWLPILG